MKIAATLLLLTLALTGQDHPVEGNAKSVVRLVCYEDLQCPDCAVYRRMMDERLLPKYAASVAFEHRDFPLAKHKWAKAAAIAGRWFDSVRPALGTEYRQWAMANQTAITPENFEAKLTEWTAARGADPAKMKAALADPALTKLVEEDLAEGVARGVARTPTVFVNGEPFIEKFTFDEISKGIDTALAATLKQK